MNACSSRAPRSGELLNGEFGFSQFSVEGRIHPAPKISQYFGLWENWKDPGTWAWVRTFTIITVPSNELVGTD